MIWLSVTIHMYCVHTYKHMLSKWKVNGSNLADDYFIEIIIFIFIHFNTISCITYHILLGQL